MDAVIENVKNGLPILKRDDGSIVLIEIKPVSIKLTRYNADDYQEHVITL